MQHAIACLKYKDTQHKILIYSAAKQTAKNEMYDALATFCGCTPSRVKLVLSDNELKKFNQPEDWQIRTAYITYYNFIQQFNPEKASLI